MPVVGTAIAVSERYNDDLGNQLGASIAFFAFLSLFPIILLALSVVGYVLADDPAQQQQVADAITSAVPGLGAAIGDTVDSIVRNRAAVGLVGFLGVLFSGLRVVDAATVATTAVFRIEDDANFAVKKARAVAALLGIGLLAIAAVSASAAIGLVGDLADSLGLPSAVQTGIGLLAPVLSFALDFVMFIVAYRILAVGKGPAWRDLWPGALLAALGWTVLKIAGATYVSNTASSWQDLYGTLGSVIGAMLLLFLAGRIYVYGAELNAVRCERRDGPFGGPDGGPAQDRDDASVTAGRADAREPRRPVPPAIRAPGRRENEPIRTTRLDPAATDARRARQGPWSSLRPALAFTVAIGAVGALLKLAPPPELVGALDPARR